MPRACFLKPFKQQCDFYTIQQLGLMKLERQYGWPGCLYGSGCKKLLFGDGFLLNGGYICCVSLRDVVLIASIHPLICSPV